MSHLGLWPNSGLSRTTRGGGVSASGLPRPTWPHLAPPGPTQLWSSVLAFVKAKYGFTLSDVHFTKEESETQKG